MRTSKQNFSHKYMKTKMYVYRDLFVLWFHFITVFNSQIHVKKEKTNYNKSSSRKTKYVERWWSHDDTFLY